MLDVKTRPNGLCNSDQLLKWAKEHQCAIAHVNANNLEWTKAIIEVAIETNSPAIIGYSLTAIQYMGGFKTVSDLVTDLLNELNTQKKIPIVLHLDHGNYQGCLQAIRAGFTSIMFDGSKLPFESNYHQTLELANLAKANEISIEAEIGQIGSNQGNGEYADLEECAQMNQIGLSCLAVGIGNIHGIYPADWVGLNFRLLKDINNITNNLPLVLHGGTGIPSEQIQRAIALGIAKININTECQIAFQKALRQYFEEGKDLDRANKGFDPRKIIGYGMKQVKAVIKEKLTLFGSLGVA